MQADEARGRPAAENEKALVDVAAEGETAEVRVLLAARADPDATCEYGWTALYYAAYEGHEEAVGALAEGGANLDKTGNQGGTPLMAAAQFGHSGVVRRLLELGADHTAVGTGGDYEGKTALEIAEDRGQEETAALLRGWPTYKALSEEDKAKARPLPSTHPHSNWLLVSFVLYPL
eukprot:COSAG02_NODE_1227_length_13780_cov_5.920401_3_plen_176_part_00